MNLDIVHHYIVETHLLYNSGISPWSTLKHYCNIIQMNLDIVHHYIVETYLLYNSAKSLGGGGYFEALKKYYIL